MIKKYRDWVFKIFNLNEDICLAEQLKWWYLCVLRAIEIAPIVSTFRSPVLCKFSILYHYLTLFNLTYSHFFNWKFLSSVSIEDVKKIKQKYDGVGSHHFKIQVLNPPCTTPGKKSWNMYTSIFTQVWDLIVNKWITDRIKNSFCLIAENSDFLKYT